MATQSHEVLIEGRKIYVDGTLLSDTLPTAVSSELEVTPYVPDSLNEDDWMGQTAWTAGEFGYLLDFKNGMTVNARTLQPSQRSILRSCSSLSVCNFEISGYFF